MTDQLAAEAQLDTQELAALTERVRGAVLTLQDPGYDEARSLWNGLIDRRPALIVQCSGAADVVDAVNFAREQGLTLSIKAGGHNVAGNAVNDGGIVIDLSQMRGVTVDPAALTVRVQGGATWGDCDRETQLFGLAVPGGVVSTTGVAGLTLHGGVGHLRRKHGLSIDSLLSVDIVTADGQFRRASATENEDLFWAVRGAGSNFGVVTSFEFQAHPVGPMVFVGAIFYPIEDAPRILPAWRDFMAAAPEELSSLAICWSIPPFPPFPPELHGTPIVAVAAAYCGPVDEGERIVQPLRELGQPVVDASGPWPWLGLQSGFDAIFGKGELRYWKSRALAELSEEAIGEILDFAGRRPSPLTDIVIWHHGGAMSRLAETETAYGGRDAQFLVTAEANWTDPAQNDDAIAWARAVWDAMERFSTGGVYLNFPGFGEEKEALARAGYGVNYERLAALKAKYDPANLFRMNINIAPAG
ncbi:MAG TPA: FAD-binding oxidoreductase [Gaiellaceae bacterium]|nr:FAD-binding oxidoreductase [Gaiellaceae bacterium]